MTFAQAAGNSGAALWSDKPKRVEKQDPSLERLPAKPAPEMVVKIDRYSLRLSRTLPFRVLDSVSFVQDGRKYRLAELDPVPVARTCKKPDGQRWACGLKSRVALASLLRGKPIRCAPAGEKDGFALVECLRGNKDIGELLATAGFATTPGGNGRYLDAEAAAKREHAGVWSE